MSRENAEIIRHAFEAFNEDDYSAFLNLYDEDIVLHISPPSIESGSYYGAKAVEHHYRRFFAPFGETYRVEIGELIEAGDSVLVFYRARARGRRSGAEVEGVNIAASSRCEVARSKTQVADGVRGNADDEVFEVQGVNIP